MQAARCFSQTARSQNVEEKESATTPEQSLDPVAEQTSETTPYERKEKPTCKHIPIHIWSGKEGLGQFYVLT